MRQNRFNFIAVEGDWPDCYKINQFVKGDLGNDLSAVELLKQFDRWPTWMWANYEIAKFIEWLRSFNREKSRDEMVGFFGLDLYCMFQSFDQIIDYLRKKELTDLLKQALKAQKCYETFRHDNILPSIPKQCSTDVLTLLKKMNDKNFSMIPEEQLCIEQNVKAILDAEKYYTSMYFDSDSSWNIRDTHMYETLEYILSFYGSESQGIVWAHNTHIGNARATDMMQRGEYNLGQLCREALPNVSLIGFMGFSGTVVASRKWGDKYRVMEVPRAVDGSWEALIQELSCGEDHVIIFGGDKEAEEYCRRRGHRAIGVVYCPEGDVRQFVPTQLSKRYDIIKQ